MRASLRFHTKLIQNNSTNWNKIKKKLFKQFDQIEALKNI